MLITLVKNTSDVGTLLDICLEKQGSSLCCIFNPQIWPDSDDALEDYVDADIESLYGA